MTKERLKSNPPMLKSKSRLAQHPRPTLVTQPCNARSSRTDKGKRSHVGFRLELGVAAPARGFTHAVSPRRLPLAATNSRPKHLRKENTLTMKSSSDSRGENKNYKSGRPLVVDDRTLPSNCPQVRALP